jgi:hypothetical protein
MLGKFSKLTWHDFNILALSYHRDNWLVNKFNQALVNGGGNYDSLKVTVK